MTWIETAPCGVWCHSRATREGWGESHHFCYPLGTASSTGDLLGKLQLSWMMCPRLERFEEPPAFIPHFSEWGFGFQKIWSRFLTYSRHHERHSTDATKVWKHWIHYQHAHQVLMFVWFCDARFVGETYDWLCLWTQCSCDGRLWNCEWIMGMKRELSTSWLWTTWVGCWCEGGPCQHLVRPWNLRKKCKRRCGSLRRSGPTSLWNRKLLKSFGTKPQPYSIITLSLIS